MAYSPPGLPALDRASTVSKVNNKQYSLNIDKTLYTVQGDNVSTLPGNVRFDYRIAVFIQDTIILGIKYPSSRGTVDVLRPDSKDGMLLSDSKDGLILYESFDNDYYAGYNRNYDTDEQYLYVMCKEHDDLADRFLAAVPLQQFIKSEHEKKVRYSMLTLETSGQQIEHFCLGYKHLILIADDKGKITSFIKRKIDKEPQSSQGMEEDRGEHAFERIMSIEYPRDPTGSQERADRSYLTIACHANEIVAACKTVFENADSKIDEKYSLHYYRLTPSGRMIPRSSLTLSDPSQADLTEGGRVADLTVFRIHPYAYRRSVLWLCVSIQSALTVVCTKLGRMVMVSPPTTFTNTWINSSILMGRQLIVCSQSGLHRLILPV